MTSTMNDDAGLLAELIACETRVWQALVNGDRAADDRSLCPDFLGVYPSGFAEKADHVGQLEHGPTIGRYDLRDFQIMSLGPEHALLSYRADFCRAGSSRHEAMYVSSVWRRLGDGWVNVFSQDTPAQ